MSKIFKPKKQKAPKVDNRAAKAQEEALAKQKQKEDLRLAEADDEVSRRKALAKSRAQGRSLLVATSETGTKADTLGG